jgi:hypothetical protein
MFGKSIIYFLLFASPLLIQIHGNEDLDRTCLEHTISDSMGYSSVESFGIERESMVEEFYNKSLTMNDTVYYGYCMKFLDERFQFTKDYLEKTKKCWTDTAFQNLKEELKAAEDWYPMYCNMTGHIRINYLKAFVNRYCQLHFEGLCLAPHMDYCKYVFLNT